jgi:arylsulfatase A-like enzyme
VLITIDTLRADRLGCYGYERPTSPNIDALARQSTLFERAYTSLPRTTQAIGSILTGRHPRSHGARGLFSSLPAVNRTLAEILRETGYETAAVVSNTFLRPGQGFEQGFDRYDNPERRWDADSAEEVTAAATAWLDGRRGDGSFFLWVHYLDPHWRYEPAPPLDHAFDPDFEGPFTVYSDLDAGRLTKGQVIFSDVVPARQVEHLKALYDGEIARTDAAVGALLRRLERVPEPLLLVLTADHGESLGEHGYRFAHGEYLYESGLRIPLLMKFPGRLPEGARIPALAMNIDIAPTILAVLGVAGMQGVEGRPLLIPASGGAARFAPAPGRSLVVAESDFQLIHPENPRYHIPGPAGRWTAASDGRYKLILIPRPGGDEVEIYDLQEDPGETRDVASGETLGAVRSRLLREAKQFADYGTGPLLPPGEESLSDEERARLRSLGYVN